MASPTTKRQNFDVTPEQESGRLVIPELERPSEDGWKYLAQREHHWRRQLSFKSRRLLASTVWGDMIANHQTVEEAADDWDLPIEAPGGELFGKALENWIHHELQAWRSYNERPWTLAYWRTAGGMEVDFLADDLSLAVEVNSTSRAHDSHLKGLRALHDDHPEVRNRVLACLESQPRRTEDGIDILPVSDFLARLWEGGWE